MNKLFTKIAALCLGATMAVGVGVAVASNTKASPVKADVGSAVRTCDFTAATTGNSNYGNTWNYASDFSVTGGANNNKSWAYCKFGGKGGSSTSSTQSLTSSVKTGPITNQIAKFSIVSNSIGTQSGVTVTSSYLYVYSDSGYSTQIDKVSLGTTYSGSGTLDATPTSGDYWAANSYYKWEITSTIKGKSNIGVCIDKLVWYQYTAPVQTYTVSFAVNTAGYGTLSSSSIANVPSGSGISVSNNTVTINGTTITATPTASTAQYTYAFDSWSNTSGTITAARTITANFTRTTNTYSVGGPITNGSLSSTASVAYGSALNITINPDSGFTYPSSLTSVTMGGSAYAGYTYNSGTGAFSIASVTGAVVITATCPSSGASEYDINYSLSHCSISNPPATMYSDGIIELTIVPADHYKLPGESANKVSVSGAVDWDYSQNDGTITIDGAENDLTVSVECVAKETYDVTLDLTNVTKSSGPSGADSVEEGEEVTIVFAGSGGYGLPASITVTMGGDTLVDNDDYVWTQETGTLWLSGLTDNLSVTIVGEAKTLLSISFSPTSGSYTLGDDFVKPTVTATYNTGAETVTDTENISYSGYDPYSATVQNVTISYGGKTADSTYKATVSAASVSTTTYYQKCTSMGDIVNGGKYVLVGYKESSKQYYVMPSYSSGNNIQGATVTLTENNTRLTEANMSTAAVYTLTSTGTTNQYYIGDGSQYLYAAGTGTNNHLKGKASTDSSAGAFTISYSTFFSVVAASSNRNTMRFNASNNPPIFSCYANNTSQTEIMFFKEVKEQSGSADLIRITASFSPSETKYVGDSISASDFVVQKQYNTGETLSPVASGFTLSANTLASTHNVITISYTEGNITETADVEIDVEARTATITSVSLVQGQGVVTDYIDWSGAAWDYTGLTVHCVWSDSSFNEDLSLADLVQGGDATVSPAKPAEGVTSFTVSYTYHGKAMTGGTVSGITVVEDYVTSISWTGTTAAHFKAFSGGQLTAAQVGSWSVVPTLAGAGVQSALSFGQYTLKVGNKTIASLPYTWASEDDGQELSITYGKDENGDDFVKKNNTAVGNICASINAIDHSETISGLINKSTGWTTEQSSALSNQDFGTRVLDANISMTGVKSSGSTNVRIYSAELRTYAGNEMYFTPSNGAIIKTINLANISATGCSDSEATHSGNVWTIKNGTEKITFTGLNKVTVNNDIVVEYQIEGEETTTVHYANDMDHFDAQKKVVEFAKFMNDTMNGTNVCSGTFANLESAWEDVADKYDELFGAETTLNETELAWAKNMLQYASPVWGSDAEAACVEKAMKTYDYCVSKYGLDEFLDGVRTIGRHPGINPIAIATGDSTSTIAIIVIISMISVTAIGGYFFLRKRKEN